MDREEAARAVERIAKAAASTATPAVLGGVGGFGALFRRPVRAPGSILVSSTDGVGTKLSRAGARPARTIGIDLVNACVNDIVSRRGPALLPRLPRPWRRASSRGSSGASQRLRRRGFHCRRRDRADADLYRGDDLTRELRRRGRRPRHTSTAQRCAAVTSCSGASSGRTRTAIRWHVGSPGDRGEPMPTGGARSARRYSSRIGRTWTSQTPAAGLRTAGTDVRALAHLTGGGWEATSRELFRTARGRGRTGSWPVPAVFSLSSAATSPTMDGSHLQPRHRDDRGRAATR